MPRPRSSGGKRAREFKKREREQMKREKAELKRQRRESNEGTQKSLTPEAVRGSEAGGQVFDDQDVSSSPLETAVGEFDAVGGIESNPG